MHFKTLARLGRFKEIIVTLLKYGFDDLVDRLEFPGVELLKKIHKDGRGIGTNERIRLILEDLGPTFIKIGQIMSLRPDLLPKDLVRELSKLQDQVAFVDEEQIRLIIEKETGHKIEDIFSVFDPSPFAAASLSQVHRAVLKKEGRIVSVKVQRPGIEKRMVVDLDILEAIADRLHERSEELKLYNVPKLVRVTRKNLMREIDFTKEARNIKIARSFKSPVYIPEVFENYCSKKILVTEFIHGAKLSEAESEILTDPKGIAKQGLNTAIKQILEDGFFHADPHPGNLIISAEKGLCLVDWGMAGRLTERDRYELIDLISAIVNKESDKLTESLLRLTQKYIELDERTLERDLLGILDEFFSGPIREMNIGQLLLAIVDVLRNYRLVLPSDLVIMIKALVTAEGSARVVYPDLDVITEASDYVGRIASKRYKVEMIWRSLTRTLSRLFTLPNEIPRKLQHIADKIERDELGIRFRHENLESLNHTLENISNRIAFSVIIAALIIGSSMIITTGIGPFIFGYPALGMIGYLVS
ncbi:MAG: ABC transporter, partial [Candidatus Aminicenantes bacterium]|nr:ABC transporter [Candidatus Aminicenantes bacterium]